MTKTLATLTTAALVLAACTDAAPPVAPPAAPSAALAAGGAADGAYIVVFNEQVTDAPGLARRLVGTHGGELRFTYRNAIKGFAVRGLPAAAAEALARNPNVAYVEADAPARLFATQSPAIWGLDRIDQRDTPLSGSYTYGASGAGVNAYVFDTGINLAHAEFGGRASYVPAGQNGDFVGDGRGSASDCHGHGTHVAGTVGGATYGVAKGVKIWAARVVDCNGSGNVSMAIAAVDWATASALRPAVVNMSLGYGDVQALRDAVERSVAAGISYAVAAGNGHWLFGYPLNACPESPAGAPNAVTVGATQSDDREASFSNYGTCVDILAPGVNVQSADYASTTGSATYSGTSMASPHVAGTIALYLEGNPSATPAQVTSALKANGTANTITLHSSSSANGTPNLFLYSANFGSGTPANLPPSAQFAFSCAGLTCSFTDQSADADGTIASRSWSFGDGATSTAQNPTHAYASGGSRTVTLTVTDDDGATGSTSKVVTVTDPSAAISLTVTKRLQNRRAYADLRWSGATGASVDVFRNGALRVTTANDGAYTDNLGRNVTGTFTYRVCSAGTATCSPNVSVTY